MTDKYVIENGKVVPEQNLMRWSEFMDLRENVVLREYRGESETLQLVFLGVSTVQPPVLFLNQTLDENGRLWAHGCCRNLIDANRLFDRLKRSISTFDQDAKQRARKGEPNLANPIEFRKCIVKKVDVSGTEQEVVIKHQHGYITLSGALAEMNSERLARALGRAELTIQIGGD